MFRINKIFENQSTYIYRIEGEITEANLSDWAEEIKNMLVLSHRQIILEMCQISYMCPKCVQFLSQILTENCYLLNCPTIIKNMLQTSGASANLLD